MSEETQVKVDEPMNSSAQDSVLRLMNTLLASARPQEEKKDRHVQIKEDEEYSDDSDEDEDSSSDSEEDSEDDLDEDWETLVNLVDSHRRLCRAFSDILEARQHRN